MVSQQQPRAARISQDLKAAVWTGQISSVESGKMSAVETGQMPAAETGQMSAVPESSGFAWACGASQVAPTGV